MTHGHELRWGNAAGGGMQGGGDKGEKKWNNCNSIINKIYLKNVQAHSMRLLTLQKWKEMASLDTGLKMEIIVPRHRKVVKMLAYHKIIFSKWTRRPSISNLKCIERMEKKNYGKTETYMLFL